MSSTISGVQQLDNRFGILGVSLSDIFDAVYEHGFGGLKNLFKDTITQSDLDALKKYNAELERTGKPAEALEHNLIGTSKAARKLAIEADGGKVKLDGLKVSANGSKLALLGMKAATIALNVALSMGLSWAISKLVEGLDNLIHASEKAAQEAKDRATESKQAADAEFNHQILLFYYNRNDRKSKL